MAFIDRFDLRQQKLINNLFSVGIIFTILFLFFSAMSTITQTGDYLGFIASSNFMSGIILLIFLYVAWKIVNGAEIHLPDQQGRPQQPRQPRQQIPRRPPKHLSIGYCNFCGKEKHPFAVK